MVKKHASSVPTAMIPLSEIHRATVFVDNTDPDCEPTCRVVRKYFDSVGIPVNVICPQKWDVCIFGWLKKKDTTNPDLFISLAYYDNFAAEYAARCSTARFKIGRMQLPGDIFDLVFTNPEGQLPLQHEAFEALSELLPKIQ